jgi:hypothetical protein
MWESRCICHWIPTLISQTSADVTKTCEICTTGLLLRFQSEAAGPKLSLKDSPFSVVASAASQWHLSKHTSLCYQSTRHFVGCRRDCVGTKAQVSTSIKLIIYNLDAEFRSNAETGEPVTGANFRLRRRVMLPTLARQLTS